jgi:hypothetical protein
MWTNDEIVKLIELYPNYHNDDIAKILGKSKSSIDNKSYRLGLKKSDALINKKNREAIHKRKIKNNKIFRDLTYDKLNDIAKNYKTRIEFIKGDSSAYDTARRIGVLDSICNHMSVIKFSTPQLILKNIMDKLLNTNSMYNDRKTIKPYELDILYPNFKLAFEFQGLYWHKDSRINDKNKLDLCGDKGITLICINEKSRDYEKDIKEQIIDNLKLINFITNNNKTIQDVMDVTVDNIYNSLYNENELLDLVKSYDSFKKFKVEQPKIYKKLLRLGIVDVATAHMVDKRKRVSITIIDMQKIINKYNTLNEFRSENSQLYKHIKKTKKDYLLINLIKYQR